MAVAPVIPVARIREALGRPQTYTRNAVRAMLPASGLVLSADEVGQVRDAITSAVGWQADGVCLAALALLDGADEEEK